MDELLVGLAALLSFLFGWNNSALLIGNLRGSGTTTFTVTVFIAILGLFVGTLLEGPKMVGSLAGSMAPTTTSVVMLVTLLVTIALAMGLTLANLPVSFSMVMVGAFMGATYSQSLPLSVPQSELVVAFWFLAPAATALITALVYNSVSAAASNFSILTVDQMNRAGALLSGLAVSYTLGANNIGLFYGSTLGGQPVDAVILLILVAVAALGVITFGRNALGGSVGDKMLTLSPQGVFAAFLSSSVVVWAGTQLVLPISINQCLLGGMLGAAYSRVLSAVNSRLVTETLSLWVLAPLAAFGLAYVLGSLF